MKSKAAPASIPQQPHAYLSVSILRRKLARLNSPVGDKKAKENVKALAFFRSASSPDSVIVGNLTDKHLDNAALDAGEIITDEPILHLSLGQALAAFGDETARIASRPLDIMEAVAKIVRNAREMCGTVDDVNALKAMLKV